MGADALPRRLAGFSSKRALTVELPDEGPSLSHSLSILTRAACFTLCYDTPPPMLGGGCHALMGLVRRRAPIAFDAARDAGVDADAMMGASFCRADRFQPSAPAMS